MIPDNIKSSIDRYVSDGIPPGSFTRAALENNLFVAIGRADPISYAHLKCIVHYISNNTPRGCWGSPDKVEKWMEEKK